MDKLQSIFNFLSAYITFQNITFVLGLIGSLGTTWNFITSRKKLRIKVTDMIYRTDIHTFIIVITFENRSRLPITITNITLSVVKNELSFEPFPRCVSEYFHMNGSEVVDRKFLYNLSLPVSLPQLGAESGHLLLDISQEDFEKLPTQLTLKVHSTRGLVQKKQLSTEDIRLTKSPHSQHHV